MPRGHTSTTATLRLHDSGRQSPRDLSGIDFEQVRDEIAHALVPDLRVALLVRRELDVTDPENRREHA